MHGKTIVITGASRGIGNYLCRYFASRGATVFGAARNPAGVSIPNCTMLPLDLRDPQSIDSMVERLRMSTRSIDILINNAADTTSKPILDTSLMEIESLVHTNVIGLLQICRTIAPWMEQTGGGDIVNISSLAGYKPNPAQTVYCVTKTAVNGASDALRAELAPAGIRVMNVALPSIAVDGAPQRGQVPVAAYAARLERAIKTRQSELFLSPITKWLMRLYKFYPPLARIR